MTKCKRTKYSTSISARRASKESGGNGEARETERCNQCGGKWHVKKDAS